MTPRSPSKAWRPDAGRSWAAARIGIALLVLLTVAGCVNIPRSSTPQVGRQIGVQSGRQLLRFIPSGPRQGSSRRQIAQDFFVSMLAYPQQASTAREFLSPKAAAHWDSSAGTVVYASQRLAVAEGGVTVSVVEEGRLDDRGAWHSVTAHDATTTLHLRFRKIDGEWRITNPDPGIYIDDYFFSSHLAAFSLYFVDSSEQVFVPDPVYLIDDDTAATALVRDLLLGPPPSLRGVTFTAAPRSAAVDVSVSLSANGLAQVPLTGDLTSTSMKNRRLLAAQLALTLHQLSDVRQIEIMAGKNPLQIDGIVNPFVVDEFEDSDPAGVDRDIRLYALDDKGLVAVGGDSATITSVLAFNAATDGARSFRVDLSGTRVAFVSADGSTAVVTALAGSGQSSTAWYSGATALLRPSWDRHGLLWLVDETKSGSTLSVATSQASRHVEVPKLGGRIESYAVSPDGVRLAAVVDVAGSTRIETWIIVRDPTHPLGVTLTQPRVIDTGLVLQDNRLVLHDESDLSWDSPTSIVVLAREAGGNKLPWQITIDGSSSVSLSDFLKAAAISLAAAPTTQTPVAIGLAGGKVLTENGSSWNVTVVGGNVRALAYAG